MRTTGNRVELIYTSFQSALGVVPGRKIPAPELMENPNPVIWRGPLPIVYKFRGWGKAQAAVRMADFPLKNPGTCIWEKKNKKKKPLKTWHCSFKTAEGRRALARTGISKKHKWRYSNAAWITQQQNTEIHGAPLENKCFRGKVSNQWSSIPKDKTGLL